MSARRNWENLLVPPLLRLPKFVVSNSCRFQTNSNNRDIVAPFLFYQTRFSSIGVSPQVSIVLLQKNDVALSNEFSIGTFDIYQFFSYIGLAPIEPYTVCVQLHFHINIHTLPKANSWLFGLMMCISKNTTVKAA